MRCWQRTSPGAAALLHVPVYRGRNGHPIWFSRDLIAEFLALAEPVPRATWCARTRRYRIRGRGRRGRPGRYRRSRGVPRAHGGRADEGARRHGVQIRRSRRGPAVIAGIVVPYINTGSYGERLRGSLERSPGAARGIPRARALQPVQRSGIFGGRRGDPRRPIHRPGAGCVRGHACGAAQPVVAAGGRFAIASIRLDGASINLTKSGPAAEWGRWNFASLVNRSVMSRTPSMHVRNGRIHFKFGDKKSVFYLTETDLDISPPGARGRRRVYCSAKPARTDRSGARPGRFTLRGRWFVAPERVDLNLEIDRDAAGRDARRCCAARPAACTGRSPRGCTWPGRSTRSASRAGSRSKMCTAGT